MNEMSNLRVATVQLHELYIELQQAGFKRREALYLIGMMLSNGMTEHGE